MNIAFEHFAFREFDFLRLLSAVLVLKSQKSIIVNQELEKKLYKYYKMPDFKILFQDICLKESYIDNKNSSINLTVAFQKAYACGLLVLLNDLSGLRSIIRLTPDEALILASEYDDEYIVLMSLLVVKLFAEEPKKDISSRKIMIGSGEHALFVFKDANHSSNLGNDINSRIDNILESNFKKKRILGLFKDKE